MASYAILAVAHAQTQTSEPTDEDVKASGITFPVPELGNCGSKDECRSYCNDQSNMEACISFAKSHGLMNKDEAERAEKFKTALRGGTTPGGCTNPGQCQAFCGDVKNMEVCVKFAEEHGVKDKHIEQAKKVLNHIKSGGQTPGGCGSEQSCKQYCSDFSHAEECFEFAKKIGIVQARGQAGVRAGERAGFEDEEIPNEEQFQKFIQLAKSGETPGGCKSKDACESYCQGGNHMEECVAFGEKVGFVSAEEAQMMRKSGGKGPGGCNSRESCESFCNDPAHQEECFKFAEEHGFVKHEEVQRTKEGFVRLRAGLEQAPPEVAECLKAAVGENVLDNIQSGQITPGPEIGNSVKGCFDKFGHQSGSRQLFKDAPPEVSTCLKEKLGSEFAKVQSGESMPSPETADTLRVCFQQAQFEKGGFQFGGPQGQGDERGQPQGGQGGFPPAPGERGQGFSAPSAGQFLRNAPPGVSTCLKEKLGDKLEAIQSGGEQPGPEFGQTLKSCFQEFNPQNDRMPPPRPDEQRGGQGGEGSGFLPAPGERGQQGGFEQGQGGFRGEGQFEQGGEQPLFNKRPYPQSVPSFNTPSPYPRPPVGSEQYPSPAGGYSSDPTTGCVQAGGKWDVATKHCEMPSTSPSTVPSGGYSSDPATGCAQAGGRWDTATKHCEMPASTTSPSSQPSPSSGTPPPSGGYSSDPATGCAQAGGTWDTSTNYCKMPGSTSPTPTSGTTQPSTTDTHSCPSGQYWNGSTCMSSTNTSGGTTYPQPSTYEQPSTYQQPSLYQQPTTQSYPSGGSYTPPPSDSGSGSYTQPPPPPPGGNLFQIFKWIVR
ncbi:MAG: hypothetical protein HY434_02255 [Candidatus Liptonbacteria bacterium]|nr:hypothetical protein [Candidatus Liptonbacteria bacterium]